MDEPTIQFSTVSDPMKWGSEGAGVICFASSEDAKRAEVIFNSVQGAAFKAGREAGMREVAKEVEMYLWLRDWLVQNNLLTAMNCKPSATAPNGDYWILRTPAVVSGDSCVGYGKDEDAAILSAIGGGQ